MPFIEALIVAVGVVVIAATANMTASNYGDLPARIPTHFGFSPEPDGYGPKPMAWMLPAVQMAVLLIAAFAAFQSRTPLREFVPIFTVVDSVLFTLLAAQWLIIETAKNGPSWSRYRTFWLVFALTLVVVPVSIAFGQ
jgi:hypothetical protein